MASSFLVFQTNPRKTKPNVNIASLKIPYVYSLAMLCQEQLMFILQDRGVRHQQLRIKVVGTLTWAMAEPQQCWHQCQRSTAWASMSELNRRALKSLSRMQRNASVRESRGLFLFILNAFDNSAKWFPKCFLRHQTMLPQNTPTWQKVCCNKDS